MLGAQGTFTANGTFAVETGKFTGRSPKDKWIVKQAPSEKNVWWGKVNQPISSQVFDDLYAKAVKHYNSLKDIYVFDGYCGANPSSRKNVSCGMWRAEQWRRPSDLVSPSTSAD